MVQGIKNKDIARFNNACNRLAKIIEEIQEYNADAHIFCNMDELDLHGRRYDSDKEYHNADAVSSVFIKGTDCGER